MKRTLLTLCMLVASLAFSQGTLTPTGIHTWSFDTNPGAGSLTVDSDSLNGNWIKLNTFLDFDHATSGYHDNIDMYGIFRFQDDSTSKIRYRNDDTILTKSTGQYNLITQVRDNSTRSASTVNALLVRTSDDDSTLSGIQAQGNGITELYGGVVVRDSMIFRFDVNDFPFATIMFNETSAGEWWKIRMTGSDGKLLILNGNDTSLTFTQNATAAARDMKIDINSSLTAGAPIRGSDAFTTTATSDTVAITGVSTTDIFVVTPKAGAANTLPVDGDLLNCWAETDKLIVNRQAGTTSGLGYNYVRIK